MVLHCSLFARSGLGTHIWGRPLPHPASPQALATWGGTGCRSCIMVLCHKALHPSLRSCAVRDVGALQWEIPWAPSLY